MGFAFLVVKFSPLGLAVYELAFNNCSCWTCIEQVVGFAFLVVNFSVLGLAVDELALNKLWDL